MTKRKSTGKQSKKGKSLQAARNNANAKKRRIEALNNTDEVNVDIPAIEMNFHLDSPKSCEIEPQWKIGLLKTYSKTSKRAGYQSSRSVASTPVLNDGNITPDGKFAPENLPPLIIEKSTEDVSGHIPCGRRIVDINFFCRQMEEICLHPMTCTGGKFVLVRETRDGLSSKLRYECMFCEKVHIVYSEPPTSTINTSLVWGALNIGVGHEQAEELLCTMDIPFMCPATFRRHERKVSMSWKTHLADQMSCNIQKEAQLARDNGDFDEGHPFITVIVDGGWSKRSYGHSFSAKSGVACIIGRRTGKLLYLGIKNKYCHKCATARENVHPHECNINYSGPSTGMEQTIIVEGLKFIFQNFNVWAKFLIGDGDSSVYARVREMVPFGYKIQKLECANHVVKCYTSKLYKLTTDTKYDASSRTLLKRQIKRLKSAARGAIIQANGNLEQLRNDLKNGPDHVFGSHSKCRAQYCKHIGSDAINHEPFLEKSNLLSDLRIHLDAVVRKADRLTENVTTNLAENYMSLVSKFVGGKRIDFSKGRSYEGRCYGAGLSHTLGSAHITDLHKRITGKSPGQTTKHVVARRLKRRCLARRLVFTNAYKTRKSHVNKGPDCEYGPEAAELDLSSEELNEKMTSIMDMLTHQISTEEDAIKLQELTIGQADNPLWMEARHKRLTASKFGVIYKLRDSTPRHNTVKNLLLRRELMTKAVIYGRINEKTAINLYEERHKVKVLPCGLFVRKEWPYLGASPDGLIGENGLVEVKCLPSIGNKPIFDAALEDNIFVAVQNGIIELKKSHNYSFQVQGQLFITRKDFCDIIIYSESGIEVIRIYPDNDFELKVLPRLIAEFNAV